MTLRESQENLYGSLAGTDRIWVEMKKLFEISVRAGFVALANIDHDEEPIYKTYAAQNERVQVYRIGTEDMFGELEFLQSAIVVASGMDKREVHVHHLKNIGDAAELEMKWGGEFLCNLGIALIAYLDQLS